MPSVIIPTEMNYASPGPSEFSKMADQVRQHMEMSLPKKLYNVPDDAPASFSTHEGREPKRKALDPPPPPIVRSNLEQEVSRKAKQLRENFPAIARGINNNIISWHGLYKYFDAQDLQLEGPVFLYYVINTIKNENEVFDRLGRDNDLKVWAGECVVRNLNTILQLPHGSDVIPFLVEADKQIISTCSERDLAAVRSALAYHHGIQKNRMFEQAKAAEKQEVQRNQVRPMAQRSAQQPEHGQSMIGHVQQIYAVQNFQALNTQRNHEQQARPPTHMGYDSFLVDQRHHINQTNGLTANFRSENNQQSDKRSRGFSNDYSNGYYSQRNNFQEQKLSDRHNNYRNQNERQYNNSSYSHSSRSKFERRNMSNYSRQSPPRGADQSTSQEPVYVHNSQRFNQYQEQVRYGEPQRVFSDPTRRNQPNDAREYYRQQHQGLAQDRPTCFAQNDPNVVVRPNNFVYYYNLEAKKVPVEYHSTRTIFLSGAGMSCFASHTLRGMMESVGRVDFINCVDNFVKDHRIYFFIAFHDEQSPQKAINKFDGYTMSDGGKLLVNFAKGDKRMRSDSHSSFNSQGYQYVPHSRQSSLSQRHHPSPSTMRSDSPLTAGFQAQLNPSLSSPPLIGAINATITEMIHQNPNPPEQTPKCLVEKSPVNSENSPFSKSKNKKDCNTITPTRNRSWNAKKQGEEVQTGSGSGHMNNMSASSSTRTSKRSTPVSTPTKLCLQTCPPVYILSDVTNGNIPRPISDVEKKKAREAPFQTGIEKNATITPKQGKKAAAMLAAENISNVAHSNVTQESHTLISEKMLPEHSLPSFAANEGSVIQNKATDRTESKNTDLKDGSRTAVQELTYAGSVTNDAKAGPSIQKVRSSEGIVQAKPKPRSPPHSSSVRLGSSKISGSDEIQNSIEAENSDQPSKNKTKKKKSKNKNKRGSIPDFSSQLTSMVGSSLRDGISATFESDTSTLSDVRLTDKILREQSFDQEAPENNKNAGLPAAIPVLERSEQILGSHNSISQSVQSEPSLRELQGGRALYSVESTPKENKSNGKAHKGRKSSHTNKQSNGSTTSSTSTRKADMKSSEGVIGINEGYSKDTETFTEHNPSINADERPKLLTVRSKSGIHKDSDQLRKPDTSPMSRSTGERSMGIVPAIPLSMERRRQE